VVRQLFEEEASRCWRTLRRVPSIHAWHALDYLEALPKARRDALCDAFAVRGTNRLYNALAGKPRANPEADPLERGHEEFRRYLASSNGPQPVRYRDPRALQQMASYIRSKVYRGELDAQKDRILADAALAQPARAPEIRKAVKKLLVSRYAAIAEQWGGGTRYRCTHEGVAFTVLVDYGGRLAQFRYDVTFFPGHALVDMATVNYEQLFNVGLNGWNAITPDNLEDCVELLGTLLERIAALPARIGAHAIAP
jgi:hypothetical protein